MLKIEDDCVMIGSRRFERIEVLEGSGHSDISMYRGNFSFKEKKIQFKPSKVKVLYAEENGRLKITFDSSSVEKKMNRFLIKFPSTPDEKIYGCGEQFSHFNLRGRTFPIFTREQGVGRNKSKLITLLSEYKDKAGGDYHTTYYPQTTFVSSKCYFVHAFLYDYSVFDFTHSDSHQIMCYSLPQSIIIGSSDSLMATAADVSALLGRQKPLPEWVHDGIILGVQGGTDVVKKKLEVCEAHGMRVAGLWAQDWEGVRITSFGKRLCWNWKWDETLYPKLDGWIKTLNKRSIRFLGYINPYIVENKSLFEEASKKGYLVKDPKGEDYLIDFGEFNSAVVDLTNPEAYRWYKDVVKNNLIAFGLSGWMADFGEYLPQDSVVFDRTPALEAHNLWPGLWAKLNHEAIEESGKADEIFYFMRAGNAMSPKYCQSVWAGDQNVDWSRDDGIGSVVPAALSLAMSGHGIHFSDLGGYTTLLWLHRTKELLVRWAQMSCFTSVMKTHEGNRPLSNWQFDSDEETLDLISFWTQLHFAIKAYIMECEQQNYTQGLSVIRPLCWYSSEEWAVTCDDQFMLGSEILVSPVLKKGAKGRRVKLPVGDDWVDIFTSERHKPGSFFCPSKWDGFNVPVFCRASSPWLEKLVLSVKSVKRPPMTREE